MLYSNQHIDDIFASHLEQIVKEKELVQQELALLVSLDVVGLLDSVRDQVSITH